MLLLDGLDCFSALEAQPPSRDPSSESERRLTVPQIREVAFQLIKALILMRNQDMIHADIKPDNVMLKHECVGGRGFSGSLVRLTDFGNAIASREVELYREDYEIQTMGYRAPEVLLGRTFDSQIDMWSFGVLLAELHIGRPLFRARSVSRMVKRIISVLGPLPAKTFVWGKFYNTLFGPDHRLRPEVLALDDDPAYSDVATVDPAEVVNTFSYSNHQHYRLVRALLKSRDSDFITFIAGLLTLDPTARFSPQQALTHQFLAPLFPFTLLRIHMRCGEDVVPPKGQGECRGTRITVGAGNHVAPSAGCMVTLNLFTG
jgi:serine/threonine protein kinase